MELKDGYDKFCDGDIDVCISSYYQRVPQEDEATILIIQYYEIREKSLENYKIQAQHNSKIDLEVMYTTIIQVVDITYLLHEEIYLLLFNKMTGRWEKSVEEKKQFLEVECNYVYLSAAIISCAAHILNWHDSQFTSVLQELTQVPARDIDGLTTIINKVILS
uniref:Cyclin N-terminal domain-containing protein n=1 Tax=Timema poppense TaxID=170557 RepID=A0A7R9CH27_TIMPO|nr:unnamed protein product [Timema poppensis]